MKNLWNDKITDMIKRYARSFSLRMYFTVLYEIIRAVTKVKENKVFFISDVRDELGGNLKCIWDYLDDSCYDKVTYLKSDRRENGGISKFNRMIYDFATSEYIMLEDYFRYTSFVRLKEGQELCQLWHACGAYKKFGYSRQNGAEGIRIHKGYKKYTKVITSSEQIRKVYAEAFGISIDKTKATGIPRTDVFFDKFCQESQKDILYKKYPALKEKKVILFAPTYRGIRAEDAKYDYGKLDFEELYQKLHEEYIFILKWHPALYNNLKRKKKSLDIVNRHPDFYLDLSDEREVNELLFIADVLITDYSSVIFEYALLGKPVVFFCYDIENYENGRGLYYNIDEYMYGPMVRTQKELIEAVIKREDMKEKREAFIGKFMSSCDGEATKRVCEWVFAKI